MTDSGCVVPVQLFSLHVCLLLYTYLHCMNEMYRLIMAWKEDHGLERQNQVGVEFSFAHKEYQLRPSFVLWYAVALGSGPARLPGM